MRVLLRRAGMAVLTVAVVVTAVVVSLHYMRSPAHSAASAGGRQSGASRGAGGPGGATGGGARQFDLGSPGGTPAAGTSGRASPGARRAAPFVTVTGAAALPSAHVHPGYTTPEDAVDGFYLALLGGTPEQACAYVTAPCPSFGSGPIAGRVTIVDAVSDGARALVRTTGSVCRSSSCAPLVDRVMMPTRPADFSASWTALVSGTYGWAGSPLPCVRDATGRWHVKLA
ncbi:MAG: hypothetical protein J2P28_03000 [Actinobacteria bacterium]|nr:hypothetical protein [Actinomycetota bacterium]